MNNLQPKSNQIREYIRYIDVIKNSNFMNVLKITPMLSAEMQTLSPDAKKYLYLPHILVGVHEVRARIGTFNNPWGATVPSWYQPAPFKFITTSLNDLADQRAIELTNIAKRTNKKIIICWSGGIDSTFILTAFLKNISPADQELITIACTSQTIATNTQYYIKFLSNNKRINVVNITNISATNEFLNKNLIVHGDPGDGIFGPSSGMYRYFVDNNQHLEPWKKHLTKIIEYLEPTIDRDSFTEPGIANWWINIVTRTLEESGQADYISSVSDLWWWHYFNFKWNVCLYPFFNTLLSPLDQTGITVENQKDYADTIFFNTADFQNWSYSNLKELVGSNPAVTHKLKPREYIYEFDKNFKFFSHKRKTSAPSPTTKLQKGGIIGYDKDFKPITNNLKMQLCLRAILTKYKES